ncbi:long-chain fatty acid--CoA ligase [Pseudomaricurvus hydrocarbonicus]
MQAHSLTTAMLIDHAERNHAQTEIVSRAPDCTLQRTTWSELAHDAKRLAAALTDLGVSPGDRVATFAWNRIPHLALYYGVTAAGMVLHTVNPRLFSDQIEYIINHGGASVLCVDPDLLHLIEPLADRLTAIKRIIVLCSKNEIPDSSLTSLIAYDELVAGANPIDEWPELEENSAATLCYTSGTTGNPKGVLYSHRSTVLHSYSIVAADAMALSAKDCALLITPLFHVNAWGVPFASALCGAKLVLPGSALDGASLYEFLKDEGVTFSLGVPTVWFGVLDYLEKNTSASEREAMAINRVFVGGAGVPRSLIVRFRELLGIDVLQSWGMTETSPVATVCRPLSKHDRLDQEARTDLMTSQGRALCGVELRVESADGSEIPLGSNEAGLLKVRGPWVVSHYFGQEPNSALDDHGWFDTGDVAWIDGDGFLHITDRAKDVIKSGGEWISSIEIENAAVAHPAVTEAAAIPVPHPRWQERPLLLITLNPGQKLSRDEMLDYLKPQMASWWLPDDVVVVEELPHTATGKLRKIDLRERYRNHFTADSDSIEKQAVS